MGHADADAERQAAPVNLLKTHASKPQGASPLTTTAASTETAAHIFPLAR